MEDNPAVVGIKIYNRAGTIVFSTKPSQMGSNQEDRAGFVTAIIGRIRSEFIYRDTFNCFNQTTEEDNLIPTYIPAGIFTRTSHYRRTWPGSDFRR